jgi:hypothetical protein
MPQAFSVGSKGGTYSCRPVKNGIFLILLVVFAATRLPASDHSDVPQSQGIVRNDANLTDLHAFVVGDNLVIALSMNAAIPPSAQAYVFASDLTFEINIDNHSEVSPLDPSRMGGTILEPEKVQPDITFRIRFDEQGQAKVQALGQHTGVTIDKFFAGLRDDPFIRGPRIGRNVASIVMEVPLAALTASQSTLLLWATAKVEDFDGPFQELVGRSLRSMMPENSSMNLMAPRHHLQKMGKVPDVMIYNTALPAGYPNGRLLSDDVVDMVGDTRLLANDAPFPSANDMPFLTNFPYLAPPHAPR